MSKAKSAITGFGHGVTVVLFIAAFAALATFLYWTIEPNRVLEIKNQPVPVRPDTISPEATIIASPTFCKYIQKPARIERFLISKSAKIPLPVYPNNFPIGCHTYDLAVIIPAFVTDDVYHLEYNVTYTVNPITQDKVHWYTQNFTVKHVPPLPVTVTVPTPTQTLTPQGKPTDPANIPSKTAMNTPTPEPQPDQKTLAQSIGDIIRSILGK